jgi:hypothetical protein
MGMSRSRGFVILAAVLAFPAAGCAAATDSAAAPGGTSPVAPSPAAPSPDRAAATSGRLATMSVADWTGFPDAGQAGVTFHLGEHCATVQGPPDEAMLLVWPDGLASIDPARPDTVRLTEPVGGAVTEITDGQKVDLGGTPVGRGTAFVTPPHASCPTGTAFLVTQIN